MIAGPKNVRRNYGRAHSLQLAGRAQRGPVLANVDQHEAPVPKNPDAMRKMFDVHVPYELGRLDEKYRLLAEPDLLNAAIGGTASITHSTSSPSGQVAPVFKAAKPHP